MIAPAPGRRPRWGYKTSIFQLRRFAFWAFALLVAGGLALGVLIQESFRQISPAGWALSWALMLVYAIPVFVLIYGLDLYEREPVSLLIGALAWGGLVAPILSGIGNEGWGLVVSRFGGARFAAEWSPALTAPFVEEIVKAVGVGFLVLIARSEFDDVMDGFVYGAMVGLGFTVVEDVFYFMGVFGGEPSGVLLGFALRVLASGLYGHVLYTGLIGVGIAYFVTAHASRGRRLAALGGLSALAVLGHFLWNSPLLDLFPDPPWTGADWVRIPLATAVKGAPLLLFVALVVGLARRREARWLSNALVSEVGLGGIDHAELAVLVSPRARRRAVREMRDRAGTRAADLLRRLQRQQVNLAMVRTRVESDDHVDLVRQRDYCRSLRDALVAIPGAAPAAPRAAL